MMRRARRKLTRVRLIFLLVFVVAFVAFVVVSVLARQERMAIVASITVPPELTVHYEMAEFLESTGTVPTPELQSAVETIEGWRELFLRKKDEVDGDEWDAAYELWAEAGGWDGLTAEEQARIAAFLESLRPFLKELRRLAAGGGPVEAVPQPPARMDMKHLTLARDCARLLWIDTIFRARNGDTDTAIANCVAGLQFADALRAEPELLSQFTGLGCALFTHSAVVDAFPPGMLSEEESARLIYQAQQDNGHAGFVTALAQSRASLISELNDAANQDWMARREMMKMQFLSSSPLVREVGAWTYSSPLAAPWRDLDIVRTAEQLEQIVEIAPLPFYEARERYEPPAPMLGPDTSYAVESAFRALESQARHEALLQLLQIGLALEQRQTSQGTLPDSMEVLSVEFPEQTLTDPFTGTAFRYEVDGDTFLLYSAGRNRRDDGGQHDFVRGDIVWRGQTK